MGGRGRNASTRARRNIHTPILDRRMIMTAFNMKKTSCVTGMLLLMAFAAPEVERFSAEPEYTFVAPEQVSASENLITAPEQVSASENLITALTSITKSSVKRCNTVAFKGGRGKKFCADEGHRMVCNRPWIKGWEKFGITAAGRGRIALKGGRFKKFCADEGNRIRCNRPWIRGWEKFAYVRRGRTVALRGGRGNKYCADEGSGVKCNRLWIRGWEKFTAYPVGRGRIALKGGISKKSCADEGNRIR